MRGDGSVVKRGGRRRSGTYDHGLDVADALGDAGRDEDGDGADDGGHEEEGAD